MHDHDNLILIKENVDLNRQGRSDRRPCRQVSPAEHGEALKTNFHKNKQEYVKTKKIAEDFIFRIIRDEGRQINFEKIGLEHLADISKTESVVRVKDETIFNANLNEFCAEKIAKTQVVNYEMFACLDEFVFQTPEEKKGPLLKQESIKLDIEYLLEIQLYVGIEPISDIHKKVIHFNKFLSSINAVMIDDCILHNLVLLKIKILGSNIQQLLEHKNVYTADLPQQSTYTESQHYYDLNIESLPTINPPLVDAPKIAIIDSGILPTHPILSGTVYDSVSFGGLPHEFDENGHGTMVAGIVQYGDVYETLSTSTELNPPFYLLNGRVTNKDNYFPEGKMVVTITKDAIEYFINNYNCTIFNLSLGDARNPYVQNTKMDPWSFILDNLNHRYNIAIVVSAGNYDPKVNNESVLDFYLNYLIDDSDSSLIPPSLSVSSLTVGSIAKDDVAYNISDKLTHVAIAKKNHISPFSRIGLGYNKVIKPDIVSYGGNYSLNTNLKRINTKDRNLGIFSSSVFNDKNKSWFETRAGTSFSAPYITHLLGKIKKEIPNAKGNLLRALLVNSTNMSSPLLPLIKEKYSKTFARNKNATCLELERRLIGYGTAREKYLTRSYDYYATMYHEGDIALDKVNVFEIFIPDDVHKSSEDTFINITLAYNPPCRDSRLDYYGVKMTYDLYRGLSLEEILKYTCKPDEDEFEKDKLPKDKEKCKCSLTPAIATANKGTLIRTQHKIASQSHSRGVYGNVYYLVVKCMKRWFTDGSYLQPFAVVVSIEHLNEKIDIYTKIKERIDIRLSIRTQRRAKS